jgi:glycosyltransferase involved in cell wall biosynthesis
MKISVITVCFNAELGIQKTLESVTAQAYDQIEIIVVDGGSTDNTITLIRNFVSRLHIWVSEPDGGLFEAMNKALSLCTGDVIIFMNAGDWFVSPKVLQLASFYLRDRPQIDVICGGIELRYPNGSVTQFYPPPRDQVAEFLIKGSLPHQATFARRRAFAKTQFFDTSLRSHADYDWFLKIATDPKMIIESAPFLVASYAMDGISSRLEVGELERFKIQNSVVRLQSNEWLRRRICIYQNHCLEQQLQIEKLSGRRGQ